MSRQGAKDAKKPRGFLFAPWRDNSIFSQLLTSTLSIPETAKPLQHSANSRFRGFFHLVVFRATCKNRSLACNVHYSGCSVHYAWNTVETGSGCNVTCAGERTVRSLGEMDKVELTLGVICQPQ